MLSCRAGLSATAGLSCLTAAAQQYFDGDYMKKKNNYDDDDEEEEEEEKEKEKEQEEEEDEEEEEEENVCVKIAFTTKTLKN